MNSATSLTSGSRSADKDGGPFMLRERAVAALASGPLSSSRLLELVCSMPGVPSAVADDIAFTLLGPSTHFARRDDGHWLLADNPVTAAGEVNAAARIDSLRYLVVDVETTGLSPRFGHRITEIAAYSVDGGSGAITEVMNELVNPGCPIPAYITSLTGISWDMVRDRPAFAAHAATLQQALSGGVFVAHNASFDWRFVSTEMLRALGRTPLHRQLCTVKLARALLPGLQRRSLDHLAFHFGVEIESRHRAAGDALATARIFSRLLRVAARDGIVTIDDLDNLIELRRRSRGRRKRGRKRGYS